MPYPRAIARLNRRLINPFVIRLAGKVAPLSLLEHRGRRSGRVHSTPVMAFADEDGFTVFLSFGERSDWAQNLLAAGCGRLKYQGAWREVAVPEIRRSHPATVRLPWWARPILALVRPSGYVHFKA